MRYILQTGVTSEAILHDMDHLFMKVVLVLCGCLIGACIGLWVGVMTMPLPNETTVYVLREN